MPTIQYTYCVSSAAPAASRRDLLQSYWVLWCAAAAGSECVAGRHGGSPGITVVSLASRRQIAMATSNLQQYHIADILEWHREKRLRLNPDFQRGNVWTTTAKVFLIDTILRRLPIPKLYVRTKLDPETQIAYREVVDGQQRLRAVIDFSLDRLQLTRRAKEFAGLRYSTMDQELQEGFLSYPLSVEQLVNAADDEVLEVFSRLNSYTVTVNRPELRHAKYQSDFRWAVHEMSNKWGELWDTFRVLPMRQRIRLLDDSLVAEMFGIVMHGVTDGGQPNIDKLYERYKSCFPEQETVVSRVDAVLDYIRGNFGDVLVGNSIARSTHFLMLFAAIAHARFGIPAGRMGDVMPERDGRALTQLNVVKDNLSLLGSVVDLDETEPDLRQFGRASRGTTHRMASRRVRFSMFYRALLPDLL